MINEYFIVLSSQSSFKLILLGKFSKEIKMMFKNLILQFLYKTNITCYTYYIQVAAFQHFVYRLERYLQFVYTSYQQEWDNQTYIASWLLRI